MSLRKGLRHAHASWLLAGGADLVVVKERLGHGTISTTEKYLHTLPGGDDAALRAMEATRGRAVPAVADDVDRQADGADVAAITGKLNQMYELMKSGGIAAAARIQLPPVPIGCRRLGCHQVSPGSRRRL